jgi:hypothetical protein
MNSAKKAAPLHEFLPAQKLVSEKSSSSFFLLTEFASSRLRAKYHLQITDMPGHPPGHLFHVLPLSLISFVHLVASAATNHILDSRDDHRYDPEFDATHYSSISEWSAAQGRSLESPNTATKECLSQFAIDEDNSVCYGDENWEWNAVAIICLMAVMAGFLVLLWLCCDWAQT